MDEHWISHNVLEAMDKIWFHQNIMKKMKIPIAGTRPASPLKSSTSTQENSLTEMVSTAHTNHRPKEQEQSPSPTIDVVLEHHLQLPQPACETRSCQSSPCVNKHPRRRIAKAKSFSELENEELKGFMDLGFRFNMEEMTPYMKNMLPGLQKLDEKQVVTRPYLSEAWLINRPDSPLVHLRMPPISASSGAAIKRHLRFWARTVAHMIHQES